MPDYFKESHNVKKLVRRGMVAVLYSAGFGAGWSTWNSSAKQCLFDPELVEWIEAGNKPEAFGGDREDDFFDKRYGVRSFYYGGLRDLQVMWIKEGTQFYISEYDGAESVICEDELITA